MFTYLKVKSAKCFCLLPVVLVLVLRIWSCLHHWWLRRAKSYHITVTFCSIMITWLWVRFYVEFDWIKGDCWALVEETCTLLSAIPVGKWLSLCREHYYSPTHTYCSDFVSILWCGCLYSGYNDRLTSFRGCSANWTERVWCNGIASRSVYTFHVPSVQAWHCWLGDRKGIRPVKTGCWFVGGDDLTGALSTLI